jgi:DNA-binding transcriptional MerR regulator
MADGSHLSIGEVLALLLEEFPDVTISKIRFLESQGLIDPERTPSGYRKFFDADVELLRVILREQRENYLPLRVIKDRIDSGELDASGEQPAPQGIRDVDGAAGDDESDGNHDVASPVELPIDDGDSIAESAAAVEATDDGHPEPENDVEVEDGAHETESDTVDELATPPTDDADAVAAAVRAAGERSPQSPTPPPPAPTPTAASAQLLSGVNLTAEELAGMVGATREEVAQLEEYGIISARSSLGERIFDEDAVEITSVAVEFLRAGVDARHLRGWKTSADRETSVYEQLVMPLLRHRNPEGRQAAREQLLRMSELGGKLREALMRATLRSHLGG